MLNDYYTLSDISSCSQHVEAKLLADKFWTQHNNLSSRAALLALELSKDSTEVECQKVIQLCDKVDKIFGQFSQVRNGLLKCCCVC